jgi:DNA helicase-2/ATP-dependent DNA helicase PcrA
VFLAGVEEDLLPHAASADEEALEEERRLCYVGMTRARRRLVLTHCALRWLAGRAEARRPSRFLAESPERHVRRTGQGRAPAPARPTRARAPGGPGSLDAGALSAVQGFFGEAVEPEDVSQEQVWEEPEYEWSGPAAAVPAAAPAPLRRGDLVRHARFGVGKILGLETVAGKTKLTVYFGAHGRVKLMAEHARLDRIE